MYVCKAFRFFLAIRFGFFVGLLGLASLSSRAGSTLADGCHMQQCLTHSVALRLIHCQHGELKRDNEVKILKVPHELGTMQTIVPG